MKLEIWDDMKAMERRVDEVLRDAFSGRTAFTLWPPRLLNRAVVPTSDMFTRGHDLVVHVELPGMEPKDVSVLIDNGELVISGTRNQTEEVSEEAYYHKEVWYGAFERRIPLPENVTEEAITATFDKGILEVVVHDAIKEIVEPEKAPPKAIPISTKATKA